MRSVSRGVFVTMAISCSRIGFCVDCPNYVSNIPESRSTSNLTHFKVVHRVNQLSIDVVPRARVRRLRVHDIYETFIIGLMKKKAT
jgi:hypothetical protein